MKAERELLNPRQSSNLALLDVDDGEIPVLCLALDPRTLGVVAEIGHICCREGEVEGFLCARLRRNRRERARINLRLKSDGCIRTPYDAAVVADGVVELHAVFLKLRDKHPIVASRDHTELVPCGTPAGNALLRLLVDFAAPEERAVVIACRYLHFTSSS